MQLVAQQRSAAKLARGMASPVEPPTWRAATVHAVSRPTTSEKQRQRNGRAPEGLSNPREVNSSSSANASAILIGVSR